jgi:hypothetical protein
MEGYFGTGCQPVTSGPTPADVAKSNQNCSPSTRSACERTKPSDPADPLTWSCPSDNGCTGYDENGYPITDPDNCQYDGGCEEGYSLSSVGTTLCCTKDGSPVLIDVSGDGFELTDAKNGVMFDLAGKGKKQKISWTAAGVQNGWLALDRNGNGTIDSGAELFGNYTLQPLSPDPNGFLALAVYDQPSNGGNGNGEIDPGDAIYNSLLIWIDRNHNGISEPEELFHLSDFGIQAISLDYHLSKWTDEYGNAFRYKAKIRIAHKPSDRWTYDVFLRRSY